MSQDLSISWGARGHEVNNSKQSGRWASVLALVKEYLHVIGASLPD